MLPITIPLVLGMFVMINSSMNPSGQLAVIFSMIPFTSPIVMMARIPFDIPAIQILASAALLYPYLYRYHMVGRKDIQNRHPYVRKKSNL